jgi:hypothetical protein
VKQRYGDADVAIFVKKYYTEVLQTSSSSIPSVLVYVNTQNDAEKVARLLQDSFLGVHSDVVVGFYHAGWSACCLLAHWHLARHAHLAALTSHRVLVAVAAVDVIIIPQECH